jgi:hypothetical protein
VSLFLFEYPLGLDVGILDDTLREPSARRCVSKVVMAHTHKQDMAHSLISFSAFSTESLPWQTFRPTARAKSPRIVPDDGIELFKVIVL